MTEAERTAVSDRTAFLPMLATLGPPPRRFGDFAVEAKYDGQRGVAILDDGRVTLLSRNGADITSLRVILSSTHLSLVSALFADKQAPHVLCTRNGQGKSAEGPLVPRKQFIHCSFAP